MNTTPPAEARIWAAISHLASLGFGMGILLPIVGWSAQRRKSNYASFQSLQALGYQSLGFTIWILSYLVVIVLAAISLLMLPAGEGDTLDLSTIPPAWTITVTVVLGGLFAVYLLLPIVAALACAFGKDFRYPFMGNRLARYLAYDPARESDEQAWLEEDHELRWVAAAGHFSVLILIWGMLAPLTAWILHGRRSFFLRFQSVQTLVYQGVVTVLFLGAGTLYTGGLLGLIVSAAGLGQGHGGSSPQVLGLVISGLVLLLSGLVILAVPLLHILGQWAGYRVLKGDDYRYPLVGRLVERWVAKA